MVSHPDGQPKGFGFVEYVDKKDAHAAIKYLHNRQFRGRHLIVKLTRPPGPKCKGRPPFSFRTRQKKKEEGEGTETDEKANENLKRLSMHQMINRFTQTPNYSPQPHQPYQPGTAPAVTPNIVPQIVESIKQQVLNATTSSMTIPTAAPTIIPPPHPSPLSYIPTALTLATLTNPPPGLLSHQLQAPQLPTQTIQTQFVQPWHRSFKPY